MTEETRQKIYDPFLTTKGTARGTGLGLSTAFAIIQQHGGWLDCQSAIAQGTTFTIYLPLSTQIPTPAVTQPIHNLRGSETLLIVEDSTPTQNSTKTVLQTYGYNVLLAADGQEGMETFRRHAGEIALILLDLSLPTMSGEEVLDELKRLESRAEIILFTDHAADINQYASVASVLHKPVDSTTLAHTVRKVLDARPTPLNG